MNELRVDWILIIRNLAQQLCSVGELDLLRRILDDAKRDAACLSAPTDFWDSVLCEYDKLRAMRGHTVPTDAREMILGEGRR